MAGRARILRVAGAIGAAVAVVAVLVGWSLVAHEAARSERPGSDAGTDVSAAEGSGAASGSAEESAPSVPGTATADDQASAAGPTGGAAAGPGTSVPVRAAIVAYRREGWLCVAGENGLGERRVVAMESGVFALAPDARTIALVDESTRGLVLADVASGRTVAVGPAVQDRPSWAPDSSWLVYTAPGASVRRVSRDGTGGTTLFAGSLPAVATDGSAVVGVAASGAPGVVVWRAGAISRIPVSAPLAGVACSGPRVFFGTAPAGTGSATLGSVGIDGRGGVELAGSPSSVRMIAICDLRLAPDGTRIAYAECGDDGYSRTFAVPVSGGPAAGFTARRDTYPLDWTADGGQLLFIEGNAFQGEATALLAARADGTGRTRLVERAGR